MRSIFCRTLGFAGMLSLLSGCAILATHGDLPTIARLPNPPTRKKSLALRIFHIEQHPNIIDEKGPRNPDEVFFPDIEIQKTISDAFVRSNYFSKVSLLSLPFTQKEQSGVSALEFYHRLLAMTPPHDPVDLSVNIQWRGRSDILTGGGLWFLASALTLGILPFNSPYSAFMVIEVRDAKGQILKTFTVKNEMNRWSSLLFLPIPGAQQFVRSEWMPRSVWFYKNCADAILEVLSKEQLI